MKFWRDSSRSHRRKRVLNSCAETVHTNNKIVLYNIFTGDGQTTNRAGERIQIVSIQKYRLYPKIAERVGHIRAYDSKIEINTPPGFSR